MGEGGVDFGEDVKKRSGLHGVFQGQPEDGQDET